MLRISADHPIDASTVRILRHLRVACDRLDVPVLLAGAGARDLLLENVYGLDPGRATRDLDFAVAVQSWGQFFALRKSLTSTAEFIDVHPGRPHRLMYGSVPVDLLPFRGVENDLAQVSWPPEMKVVMNVAGYEEVLDSAVSVSVEPHWDIRVASLPGLALMKIFAWVDRGAVNSKDALDLVTLCRTYADAGNLDRVFHQEQAMMQLVDYAMERASPWLLGLDLKRSISISTTERLMTVLHDTKRRNQLAVDMSRALAQTGDPYAAAQNLLSDFMQGLRGNP